MIAAREMMSIPVTTTATRTMMTMSNSRSGSAKTEKRGGRILRASRSILPIFLVYLLQCAAVPCLASTAPHVAAATPTLQQQHLRRQQQRQQKYPHEKAEARSRRNVASHDSFHRVMAETKAASDSSSSVTCKPADVCVMCTGSDKEKWSACARTGRMQRFECFSNANDDADNEKSHERAEIRSCERTQADEHFLMVSDAFLAILPYEYNDAYVLAKQLFPNTTTPLHTHVITI
uniref:Uncharacterized protein n=1 Tax=Craspedostauros australis TaxID=1486917 RepID=A0A7R9ZLB6_9STRA|mmetsp:Transcript_18142/g.50373  ORF Transcript_18142/g.50373 Transcript_18142/m.50373 type:complete len:234 (+) Transcript_18142:62-763(+)